MWTRYVSRADRAAASRNRHGERDAADDQRDVRRTRTRRRHQRVDGRDQARQRRTDVLGDGERGDAPFRVVEEII